MPDKPTPLPPLNKQRTDIRQNAKPSVRQRSNVPAIDPHAVEQPQDRTADTQTFVNPDGTKTLRVYDGQKNVRQPNGTWASVDFDLSHGANGRFQPKVAPLGASFAADVADASLARLAFDDRHVLMFGIRGAVSTAGHTRGSAVTYPGALPDVDVRESVVPGGIKEDLIVRSVAAPTAITFDLRTIGLVPVLRGSAVDLLDNAGKVRATIPVGSMTDSADTPASSTGVSYVLAPSATSGWTLTVVLDSTWLHDPARIFPVTVDPSVSQFNADTDDTYVLAGDAADHSAASELRIGTNDDGKTIARSYLHFSNALISLRNDYIVGASLDVESINANTCQPTPVTLFEAAEHWSGSQVYPGAAAGRALDTESFSNGFVGAGSTCVQGARHTFHISPDVATDWTHGEALANGLTLRAANERDNNGYKFLASANSANPPFLDVRFSPEGAAYRITNVLLPTANQQGNFTAVVTNRGSSTWPADGGYRLGYVLRQNGAVVSTSQGVAPATAVGPGGSATIQVPLVALTPGTYELDLTMWTPAGQDFNPEYGVPYGVASIRVSNVAPTSDTQQPGDGATVQTLTPTLYAHGVDPDDWPGQGLTFQFMVCTDAALTQNCVTSLSGGQAWTVPSGDLFWSQSYFWAVKVDDTVNQTPFWVGPLALTTEVPQPEITSHLAGSPNTVEAPGLDPQIGNYSTTATDATVATVGPDLTITRTYNSLDPRRDTAFGVGWASRLDMRLVADTEDGIAEYVLVTYPDGRQVRFGRNPDGTFGSPLGQSVDLVFDPATGFYTLRDSSGTQWQFDILGRLNVITDPAGLTEHLAYDTDDHVTTITNDASHRALTFTWTGDHVSTVAAPSPEGTQTVDWNYGYTADSLTSVCAPGQGANCTTYTYASGSHYRSSVLDDSPRAYYRMDETTGATFANATAREPGADAAQQTGVVLGSAGALMGSTDQAATFDGQGSYVTLPDGLVNVTMSAAVEMWFKTTADGTLLSYADQTFPTGTPTVSVPLLYVGADGQLYGGFAIEDGTGPRQIVTSRAVNDGQWHQVVLSADIDSQTMYVDGAPVGTLSGLIDHATLTKMTIGGGFGANWPSTNGGSFYFNGSIDEVAVYQHPLSLFAVGEHFASGAAIDELTVAHQAQDNRLFAQLSYDDHSDRVHLLTDHDGRAWTLDNSVQHDATRSVTLHGPYPDFTYTFDADHGGRLTGVTHLGATRSYEYNIAGFLSAIVDEDGNRTSQTTDSRGNVLSTTTCQSQNSCDTQYFTYVQSTNPLDPRRDKLATSSDARSSGPDDTTYRTTYAYDSAGRLTTTTYPIPFGQVTAPASTNTYATGTEAAVGGGTVPAGVLLSSTGERGQQTTYKYNAAGDVAQSQDPQGLITKFAYDGMGRAISKALTNGGGANLGITTYTYTPLSQVQKVTGPTVTNPITSVTHTETTTYSYDADGNVLSTTVADAQPETTGGDTARTTSYTYNAHGRLATTTLPNGGSESYSYSADLLEQTTTDVNGIQWTDQYDDQQRLISETATGAGVDPQNPNSDSIGLELLSYTPAGRLARVSDAMGRNTDYTYYENGLLASSTVEGVQQPDGTTRNVVTDQRSYDPAGNLTLETIGGNQVTSYTYDPAGNVRTSTVDPDGVARTTAYVSDPDGNPVQVSITGAGSPGRTDVSTYTYSPDNQMTSENVDLGTGASLTASFVYDARGLLTSLTDARQITTHFTYDANGNAVSVIDPPHDVWTAGQDSPGVATTQTVGRNAFGEITQSRDTAGNVTTATRDQMGQVTATTNPNYAPPAGQPIDAVTKIDYDLAGNPVKSTDALGQITTSTYDPYGNLLSTALPQVGTTPNVVSYSYDRDSELLRQTQPSGAQTQYTYDQLGRQITSTDAERFPGPLVFYTTKTDYDDAGDITAVHTPQGNTTSYAYNGAGDQIKMTDPMGVQTLYGYDLDDRQNSVTDATGLTTAAAFDPAGRATTITQSVNGQQLHTWTDTYDPDGDLASTTSPDGRKTTYGYDELDRLAQQVEQVDATHSITTSIGYDALGNRSHVVDGRGNATDYTYNSWGLPESRTEPATATAPNLADRTWTIGYDADGQPTTLSEPGGISRTNTYDAQGNLTGEHGTGPDAATADRTLAYDADGRLTTVGSSLGDTTYSYDDRGDVIAAQGPTGNQSYSYNGDGTLAARTDGAGTASFTYNADDQLSSATDPLTGRAVDYRYDSAGRLSFVGDRSVDRTIARTLAYDPAGRLSSDQLTQSFDVGVPSRTLLANTYSYDGDGNVTGTTSTVNGTASANSYTYDGANRLTSWTTAGATTDYTWDASGNRTGAGSQTYTYDERNQLLAGAGASYTYSPRGTLATVTGNGVTTSLSFDAFDRLVGDGSSTYGYDGLDRVAERDGDAFSFDGLTDNLVTDGSDTVSRLPDGSPLADETAGSTSGKLVFTNQHGDVTGRYLGATVTGTRTYDPFGDVMSSAGATSDLGYQGDMTDSATGAVDMSARWYQPATAQFMSEDAWDLDPNPSSAALNRYAYAADDPIGNADPTGHFWCEVGFDVAGGAIGALFSLGIGTTVGAAVGNLIGEAACAVPAHAPTRTRRSPQQSFSVDTLRLLHDVGPWYEAPDGGTSRSRHGSGRSVSSPRGHHHSLTRGLPVPITPPPPPPPPNWYILAHTAIARPAAGATVTSRQRSISATTSGTTFTDPGPGETRQATSVTAALPQTNTTNVPALPDLGALDPEQECLQGNSTRNDITTGPLEVVTFNGETGERATGAVACLVRLENGKGEPKAPFGFTDSKEMQKGHLIARMFGGSADMANIVPLYRRVNHPDMRVIENRVRATLVDPSNPQRVYYQVTPLYDRNNPVPWGIDIEAAGSGGFKCKAIIANVKGRSVKRPACG